MKHTASGSGISRRRFLATTGVVIATPGLIRSSALGKAGNVAASERITLGVVGWGMQGPGNTEAFLNQKDCQVVAACDIDQNNLQSALNKINSHYGNQDCKPYHDYREMMARSDIDAVMLAVPDTWHALTATEAARSKKDIYGEKPLARTIAEQQAIVKAVQQNNRIWQTGSWQRSQAPFRKAAEIVRNGLIGKVTRVEVGLPAGHHDFAGTSKEAMQKMGKTSEPSEYLAKVVPGSADWNALVSSAPPELDYETWLRPSQMEHR